MKIYLAGASGAIGRRLVPRLVASGHEVIAATRSAQKAAELRLHGAEPVVVDGLDESAMLDAVSRAEPEVVIHEITALTGATSLRRFDRRFAATNELRTRGTDHLLRAARLGGARRLIAQSFAGWPNIRAGSRVKTEDDPLDPSPPSAMRQSLGAIRHLEQAVTHAEGLEGIVLRYGTLYGPGTGFADDGEFGAMVRRRRVRSSATVGECGPSSTSTTRQPRRWPRSSGARRGYTTSSTTNRRPWSTGCLSSLPRSARDHRGTCPSGSAGSPAARLACR
jgi:nucleoside-diphosphate-sugar epimerase